MMAASILEISYMVPNDTFREIDSIAQRRYSFTVFHSPTTFDHLSSMCDDVTLSAVTEVGCTGTKQQDKNCYRLSYSISHSDPQSHNHSKRK